VDAIATDHAPHASHEKQVEFEHAAFGITGLETALALAITSFIVSIRFRWRASSSFLPLVRLASSICAARVAATGRLRRCNYL